MMSQVVSVSCLQSVRLLNILCFFLTNLSVSFCSYFKQQYLQQQVKEQLKLS